MVLENFTENIIAGLNNPECSFFVGATIGQYFILRLFIWLAIVYIILRVLERLIFTPFLEWIYKIIYRRKMKK